MKMNEIEERRLLNTHRNIFVRPTVEIPFASELIDPTTAEHYHLCSNQCTIRPKDSTTPLSILTESGRNIYEAALRDVEKENFKGRFVEYCVDYSNSGSWFEDVESQHYKENDPFSGGCRGMFNTFQNIVITGIIDEMEKPIRTSSCIFFERELGWCLTKSGSLYRLKDANELDIVDFNKKYFTSS